MSSLTRRIAKGRYNPMVRTETLKKRGEANNPIRDADDRGYSTCHFTKGWRRISFARLHAQRRMALLLGA